MPVAFPILRLISSDEGTFPTDKLLLSLDCFRQIDPSD